MLLFPMRVLHAHRNNDLPSAPAILKESIAVASRLRDEYFG
jgi:hypothetical protein